MLDQVVIEAADILHGMYERLTEVVLVGQTVELLNWQKEMKVLRHWRRYHDLLWPNSRRHQPNHPRVRARVFLPSCTDPRDRTISWG